MKQAALLWIKLISLNIMTCSAFTRRYNSKRLLCDQRSRLEARADGAIGLKGKIPCATMGGLKARGFPGGASGVYQAVEAATSCEVKQERTRSQARNMD